MFFNIIYWVIFLDKLKRLFNVDRRVFVFLLGIVIIGVFFGSILPLFLSADDKTLVSDYLISFIDSIDSFNVFYFLKNGFINNFLFLILIWVLGVSIIGVAFVVVLFFYKCFVFGFSLSSIISNYGFKGILFSFSYVFPHQVLNLFIFLIMTSYSLLFSLKFLGYIFKRNDFNIRVSFRRYLYLLFWFSIFIVFSILYEVFINPYVLRFVLNLLGI